MQVWYVAGDVKIPQIVRPATSFPKFGKAALLQRQTFKKPGKAAIPADAAVSIVGLRQAFAGKIEQFLANSKYFKKNHPKGE
jgi:hypothetical protein